MRTSLLLSVLPRWLALSLSLLGAQAFAQYVPTADGVVLAATDTSNRYLVAGGARFFISPLQWSLFPSPTVSLPQAFINTYTQVPREGTLLRQHGMSEVHVVVNQMYWFIPSLAELDHWDDGQVIQTVPNGWGVGFYDHNFGKKMLVLERSTSQVYLWVSGAKFPITNSSDLNHFGGLANAKSIPLGSLASTTNEPYCGTILRERSSSTVYETGWYRYDTSAILRKQATTLTEHSDVPDGALTPIPTFIGLACIS